MSLVVGRRHFLTTNLKTVSTYFLFLSVSDSPSIPLSFCTNVFTIDCFFNLFCVSLFFSFYFCLPVPENTHLLCKGKYHCTDDILLNGFGFE